MSASLRGLIGAKRPKVEIKDDNGVLLTTVDMKDSAAAIRAIVTCVSEHPPRSPEPETTISGTGFFVAPKVFFALVIKNSPGYRRDFRVKMWRTSSPDDKVTGDLGNVIEAAQIGVRQSDRLTAENHHLVVLDFYNTICQKPTFRSYCKLGRSRPNSQRFMMRPQIAFVEFSALPPTADRESRQ
jgi:hypothetical protein